MLALWDRAAATGHVDQDAAWYQTAHNTIAQYARDFDVDVDVLTGMVAATSPRVAWDLPRSPRLPNLELAIRALEIARSWPDTDAVTLAQTVPAPGMLRASLAAAVRIARGERPLDVLAGPKTRAFYQNLSAPQAAGAVTIDTHMCFLMTGASNQRDALALISGKDGYQWAAARVAAAARKRGTLPHMMQAATWAQWRRDGGQLKPHAA